MPPRKYSPDTVHRLRSKHSGLDDNLNYVEGHTIDAKYKGYKEAGKVAGEASTGYTRKATELRPKPPYTEPYLMTGTERGSKGYYRSGHQTLQPLARTAADTADDHATRREDFNHTYQDVISVTEGKSGGHAAQARLARTSADRYEKLADAHQKLSNPDLYVGLPPGGPRGPRAGASGSSGYSGGGGGSSSYSGGGGGSSSYSGGGGGSSSYLRGGGSSGYSGGGGTSYSGGGSGTSYSGGSGGTSSYPSGGGGSSSYLRAGGSSGYSGGGGGSSSYSGGGGGGSSSHRDDDYSSRTHRSSSSHDDRGRRSERSRSTHSGDSSSYYDNADHDSSRRDFYARRR